MLSIDSNNTITLTRGDTAYLDVNLQRITDDTDPEKYEIEENDVLKMTVRKTDDSDILLQKVVTGSSSFHIYPEDTSSLEYGSYVYDVEFTRENGDVFTIVNVSKLKITKEVTY